MKKARRTTSTAMSLRRLLLCRDLFLYLLLLQLFWLLHALLHAHAHDLFCAMSDEHIRRWMYIRRWMLEYQVDEWKSGHCLLVNVKTRLILRATRSKFFTWNRNRAASIILILITVNSCSCLAPSSSLLGCWLRFFIILTALRSGMCMFNHVDVMPLLGGHASNGASLKDVNNAGVPWV